MADAALLEYKMQFARLLQKYPLHQRLQYSHQVAKQVVGKENELKYRSYILQIGDEWPNDPEVVKEIERLDSTPKTMNEYLKQVWDIVVDQNIEYSERIKALRLYGDVMKWTGESKEPSESNKHLDTLHKLFDALKSPVET